MAGLRRRIDREEAAMTAMLKVFGCLAFAMMMAVTLAVLAVVWIIWG